MAISHSSISTLIFEYLEEAYPSPPLHPATAVERARCRLLELYGDEILLADVRALMYRTEPPDPEPARQRAREEAGRSAEAAILLHYRHLDERLAHKDYLCGSFTFADIAVFITVLYALRLKGPRLDGFPALAAWYERVRARPAIARVTAEIAAADRELSPHLDA